ncbi:UDP-N-acetylglucosamine/UDP-N-acetylgalactosamine diphosphorylase [Nematocida minor]|uniref:UDP-N-acetylglucosamine/UDP-N- acetylgalactosamine diphosphorylase n=1 Tax=Nematocida minor TaxID=1912983 RepID=UPI00221F6098|nr:UDP-N-acetylglucosamine/UDP-N-acetylgalactosamine diphosphorylase [Nematocida minor]KAI5193217.1 UDP-N-acetylglucosamine/UDP-N-acetylgalactosamine diphosphorylase [Nematocida minor]
MHLLLKDDPERKQLGDIGSEMVEEKKVAVLTLAGGSGSRLGYSKPKGTFVLPTENTPKLSLFQRQAKKIFAMGAPWVIMVSNETISQTIEHLQTDVLTLFDMEVFLITQQDIDALDLKTREPLVNEQGATIKVPNGNGSVFKTLKSSEYVSVTKTAVTPHNSSIVSKLAEVKYFNVISVDNVLVRIADPEMVGYAKKYSLEVVSAGIPEAPNKKMGAFELHGDKIEVTEYTCEDSSKQPLVNKEGKKLVNIANHLISKEYIQRMNADDIPYNEAIKKIPHKGNPAPESPNAIKRELFIFDGFKWAKNHGVVEYGWDAYEGLKNKEGSADSIATCTQSLDNQ